MTIGIDIRLWNQTGVGRYIRNLVLNLYVIDKKNNYVLFVNSKDRIEVEEKIINSKWKVIVTDIKWHSLSEQINFSRIISKENPDLMHFPYISVPVFYNKPYVVTVHDLIPLHFTTGKASTLPLPLYLFKRIGYERVIRNAIKRAQAVIVPSDFVKEDVKKTFKINEEKIVVTKEATEEGLGWNTKEGRQKTEDLGQKTNGKYFLYVGNAYPHKNLERLIKGFNIFNKKNIKLILVGKSDHFYRNLEVKFKSENIIFYGSASEEQLRQLYGNCLALVQPSLMEGFGLTVLEAMANKCLVLASNIPVIRELAKDTIVYFNPLSAEDIAKQMEFVHLGKTPDDLKEKAYLRSKEFSWEKTAKETLEVYEKTL